MFPKILKYLYQTYIPYDLYQSKYAKRILNKNAKTFNKTYVGLKNFGKYLFSKP